MSISDYYNSIVCVNKFGEGTAPDYEPGYTLQDEFYGLLDRQSSTRIWSDKGSSIKIDSKFFCDSDIAITEKDRLKAIEDHIISLADKNGYHKSYNTGWTLTTSAAIGEAVIFYQAEDITGTNRKADGQEYAIYSKKNPNEMNRHFELMLEKVGE
jgi:hypothetical protein